ncbi:MAG TPA: agmatinase family protein [Polyangiaceae bacterium]|jgi:agmatinase
MTFDPNAAAERDAGIFGLPTTPDEARVVVVPVPWDATTSYRAGASAGPRAIFDASRQVDLYDAEVGKPYERGIAMLPESAELRAWNEEARAAAEEVIEAGGRVAGNAELEAALAKVNALSERVNEVVYLETKRLLNQGRIACVLGGDHAAPFGAMRAYAERFPGLGVLHVDAHADLRRAYEGFSHSHASIMENVMRLEGVSRIVQVGIRDFCEEELERIGGSSGRVRTFFDVSLAAARMRGALGEAFDAAVATLPEAVYVSFDIDGLDPALCPHTGTPVPGGLSFHEASALLGAVSRSGRRIVGFDLNEVAPSADDDDEWDANVGARLLYKLIGWTLLSQRLIEPPRLP